MTKHSEDVHVEVEYDGPIDSRGKRHIGPFIASGADGVKVMFLPGANKIPAEQWLAVCETHGVKWRLDEDFFRVLFDGTASGSGEHYDITTEHAMRAVALIGDTIDPDILQAWLAQEKARPKRRKSVLKALDVQLAACELDPEKRRKITLRPHTLPEGVE